jgi:hypothetical protein
MFLVIFSLGLLIAKKTCPWMVMFSPPHIFVPKHNKPFGSSLNSRFQKRKRKERTLNVIMDELFNIAQTLL